MYLNFITKYYKVVTIESQHQNEFEVQILKILEYIVICKKSLNLQKQFLNLSLVLDELQRNAITLSSVVEIWKDLIETEEFKEYKASYFEVLQINYRNRATLS